MTKHHQRKEKQINNKSNGAVPFHHKTFVDDMSEPMASDIIQTRNDANHVSIQIRAYKAFRERGGSELDNWLEAERDLAHERNVSAK